MAAKVNHIVVSDLRDNTFYATISMSINNHVVNIDSRPSDAIAVALRVEAPIYVAEKVIDMARGIDIKDDINDSEKWRNWLENLKPEDFGREV